MNEENKNEENQNEERTTPINDTEKTVSLNKETASAENTEPQTEAVQPQDSVENAEVSPEEAPAKKSKVGLIVTIAVIVVVVAAAVVAGILKGPELFNKYNKQYIDVSGRTIEEVADGAGMDLADFLSEYGLPSDMPANTSESAAYYNIPVSKMAEMYGMTFDDIKSELGWDDSITESTTWGEAEGSTKLGMYVGEENLQEFKDEYGLGDDVTADTLWKDVRTVVDTKQKETREAQEKATPAPTDAATEALADAAADTATTAPADAAANAATTAPAAQ